MPLGYVGTPISRWLGVCIIVLALGTVAAGCGPPPTPTTLARNTLEYSAFSGATEFIVGTNRVPFFLTSVEGENLEGAQVQVRFYSHHNPAPELRSEAPATFHEVEGVTPHVHEDGKVHEHVDVRGMYAVGQVSFDRPGLWTAEFTATIANGQRLKVRGMAFVVQPKPVVPGIGEKVPSSRNLTIADVDSIDRICSGVSCQTMHDLSVAQALEQGKPFVVVFSSPLFCVSRMCGPVTDTVAALQRRYGNQLNFVHIEPWDLAIARRDGRLVPTREVDEWRLPTEPWVFVVSKEGHVLARFEGLVSSEEVEAAIEKALS